jgi:hypothetical protein
MVEHVQRAHQQDPYVTWECKFPGCEGSKSRFTYEGLKKHLWIHHDIDGLFHKYVLAANKGDTRLFPDGTVVTCKNCSEHRGHSDQSEVSKRSDSMVTSF